MSHKNSNNPDNYGSRQNNHPNNRKNVNNSHGNSTNFERNKYRQSMPSNSRFNPLSPPEKSHVGRFNSNNNPRSPTQSHVSTATTYEQPWSSPKFQPPSESNFRRTHSVAVRKTENPNGADEQKKSDRPKINFRDFGRKFTNKFRKNDSKKSQENSRLSAPIIKLSEPSTSNPSLPTPSSPTLPNSCSPAKKKTNAQAVSSMKMQEEEKKKMYQKMGRQQAMKETSVQRMQRERQRDFSLVPGPGRACLEANTSSSLGSTHSIESMVVYNTAVSRRTESMSTVDDDVEPVFKNSLTNKHVTSSQMAAINKRGPPLTSTPRLITCPSNSPTISSVRSVSEASLCIMTSENDRSASRNHADSTMYFSAHGLNGNGRDTPQSIALSTVSSVQPLGDVTMGSTASTPTASSMNTVSTKVKQEIYERDTRSSNCPSISSTVSDVDNSQRLSMQAPECAQPGHLNDLWLVSKEIRENQLKLERCLTLFEHMKTRNMEIDQEKATLIVNKGENPSTDDMRRMWDLHREQHNLLLDIKTTSDNIQIVHVNLPYLESRRNELLAISPQPSKGSLV